MPARPPVTNVLQVVLKHESDTADQDIVNRFYLQFSGTPPVSADLVEFAQDVSEEWTTYCAPEAKSTLKLSEVSVEDLTSPTSAVGILGGLAIAGTRSGPELSAGAAVCMQQKIARRYRGGHPRQYLMWGTQLDLATTSAWLTASAAEFEVQWLDFITHVLADAWTGATLLNQVNVSYYSGFTNHTYPSGRTRAIPTLRVSPLVDPILGYNTNPRVASQRRRNQQGS